MTRARVALGITTAVTKQEGFKVSGWSATPKIVNGISSNIFLFHFYNRSLQNKHRQLSTVAEKHVQQQRLCENLFVFLVFLSKSVEIMVNARNTPSFITPAAVPDIGSPLIPT